jgi:hypothetical protein
MVGLSERIKCFFIRGDFKNSLTFYRIDSSILSVKLHKVEDNVNELLFALEPSLQGAYLDCHGWPISLEIYTKGKISGYEMKIPKTHNSSN